MMNSGGEQSRTSYAVLGAGAVGGLYGGLLANSGLDVHFLMRSDYAHVRQHGLRVDTPLGDFHLPQPNIYPTAMDLPKVDVVLVCWKTTQNAHLAEALRAACHSQTIVLVLQNGLDVERAAAEVVGEERVLGGCCFLCSNRHGPGHIHHLDFGRIAFGEYGESLRGLITERMQRLTSDFTQAKINMQPTADLQSMRWRKLMWNIPYNGLSVILQADTQKIMSDPQASMLAEELMIEVRDAAAACGRIIELGEIAKMLEDTRKMVPYDSSMLLDYRHGRAMEVESIFGNPLRAALAAGYRPAKVEMLYRQLSYLNRK
jgi:2-dehydropantoate 2-reductase